MFTPLDSEGWYLRRFPFLVNPPMFLGFPVIYILFYELEPIVPLLLILVCICVVLPFLTFETVMIHNCSSTLLPIILTI